MQSETAFSPELAQQAINLVMPTITNMMKSHMVRHGHLHITVGWTPPANPHTNVVPIAERSLGDVSTWEMDYKAIAEGKRTMVARERISSREVVDQGKSLEGEPPWPGGVIVEDAIVTISGLESEFDELFSYMIAHAIVALRHNEERKAAA
ncbi:hypothetical protein KBD20_03950 [Candidatus Saccharibacteria bacterium]|nr:hypothetical protein [Candidatus Saccharibacteria bacterium]